MTRPAILLLHGTASSSSQWRSLSARLGERYDVIAPDLVGYGGSPGWSGRGRFSLEAEVRPLLQRLEGVGPVHVVAHSFGAATALHLARTRAPMVRSLLLYEPAAFHLLRDGDAADQLALADITGVAAQIMHSVWQGHPAHGVATFIDYWNGEGAWASLPAERRAALASYAPQVVLDFQAAVGDPARVRQLRLGAMPRTLVHGDRSPAAPLRITMRLAEAWPRAKVRMLAGAGHMGPVTHRDAFNDLVEEHLAACEEQACTA